MNPRGLTIAAVLLAVLSGVVWWAKKHPQSGSTSTATPTAKVADIPADQIQQITVKKKDGTDVVVKKESGKWKITAPEAFAADQDAVSGMTSSLSPLTADSVVDEKATNLGQYGLAQPALTVSFALRNGKTEAVEFGDEVPGGGSLIYAQHGSDPKVYLVSSAAKTSLDKSLNDLRDKRLLTFDSGKLTSLELATAKGSVAFGKNNQGDWQIVKPKVYRADSFQVEDLIRKLQDAKMDLSASADDEKKAAAAYATGQPVATVKTTDASGTQTLDVRKNKTDYYAKSSAVSGIYKTSSDLGTALDKTPDAFRNKKLFDFGFNDPTKLELRNGSADGVYTKSGADWKLNGKTMDAAAVQTAIDQLRDLTATGFPANGFANPTIDITVVSNDGKRTEKVSFEKKADKYLAKRENEAALYELAGKPVDDLLAAFGTIKPAEQKKK